jgi:Calcineurin-like phosphoesterase
MKLLLVGDTHFQEVLPYASLFKDGRRNEWESVKQKIVDVASSCDEIILMGDSMSRKNNPSIVIDEFVKFVKTFGDKPVHILIGNHCRSGTVTSLDFLKSIQHPNIHVYDEVTQIKIGDKTATMLPYYTFSMVGAENKKDGIQAMLAMLPKTDYLFLHHGVDTALSNGASVGTFDEIVLPTEFVKKTYAITAFGHIHEPAHVAPGVLATGSMFTSSVGEHKKFIFTLDTETNKMQQINLPARGIYSGVHGHTDIGSIPRNSIVKYTVRDKTADLDALRKELSVFDAHVIVTEFPNERRSVEIKNGELDLSLSKLFELYSEARNVNVSDLTVAFAEINKTT